MCSAQPSKMYSLPTLYYYMYCNCIFCQSCRPLARVLFKFEADPEAFFLRPDIRALADIIIRSWL